MKTNRFALWLTVTLVFIALAIMCRPVSAQTVEHGPWHTAADVSVGAYMVGQFSDGMVSAYLFGAGQSHELNPILRWTEDRPVAMAVIKGSIAVGVSAALLKLRHRKPKTAFLVAAALTGVQIGVTWHNAKQVRRDL